RLPPGQAGLGRDGRAGMVGVAEVGELAVARLDVVRPEALLALERRPVPAHRDRTENARALARQEPLGADVVAGGGLVRAIVDEEVGTPEGGGDRGEVLRRLLELHVN